MKNFISVFILTITLALPTFAECPLNGMCTTPTNSAFSMPSLNNKYIPNNLNNMQKTNAFQPQIVNPYNETRLNFGETQQQAEQNAVENQVEYNANCQFGVCMP